MALSSTVKTIEFEAVVFVVFLSDENHEKTVYYSRRSFADRSTSRRERFAVLPFILITVIMTMKAVNVIPNLCAID